MTRNEQEFYNNINSIRNKIEWRKFHIIYDYWLQPENHPKIRNYYNIITSYTYIRNYRLRSIYVSCVCITNPHHKYVFS